MRSSVRFKVAGGLALVASIAFGWSGATSAAPIPTTLAISVDPVAIGPGESAVVTATITPDSGEINCGKGHIQYRIFDATNAPLTDWLSLENNIDVVANQFSSTFDSSVIAVQVGEKVSFRAGYASSGGGCDFETAALGLSPTVDLLITSLCPAGQSTGVFISIEDAAGNGTPAPGDSGPWSFKVKVLACEDVYGVSAQGGANGWAPIKFAAVDTGSIAVRNANKRNDVYLWTIGDLAEGQQAVATITVDGTIKNTNGECGKVKLLNGDWSALFATEPGGAKTKSAYTNYTSTITVTCS